MRDVGLGLAFEKAFVTALAQTSGRIDHKFGIAHKRYAPVAGQIKIVGRQPGMILSPGTNLEMNQIMLASVMPGHGAKGFPIDTLFINTQTAPLRLILKNLMRELIDAGTGFAGTGITGDQPAATKLIAPPDKTAQPSGARRRWNEQPSGGKNQQRRRQPKFHGP